MFRTKYDLVYRKICISTNNTDVRLYVELTSVNLPKLLRQN